MRGADYLFLQGRPLGNNSPDAKLLAAACSTFLGIDNS
jgi:hypothetical protein